MKKASVTRTNVPTHTARASSNLYSSILENISHQANVQNKSAVMSRSRHCPRGTSYNAANLPRVAAKGSAVQT